MPTNVMPLSGRGGARAALDRASTIPPPRSAPAAGYAAPRRFRQRLKFSESALGDTRAPVGVTVRTRPTPVLRPRKPTVDDVPVEQEGGKAPVNCR
jgi:hypothetical protein